MAFEGGGGEEWRRNQSPLGGRPRHVSKWGEKEDPTKTGLRFYTRRTQKFGEKFASPKAENFWKLALALEKQALV